MLKLIGPLVFLGIVALITAKHNLIHVHTLFRHGDRSSIKPFVFNGYNPYEVWPDGLGQLTQQGIEQHFLLGKWLRNEYRDFMKPNYNVSTFHMRSSDIDRSLMSAQAMMAGFFYDSDSSLSKYGLKWRPVPTHTVPTSADILLSFSPCPRLSQRMHELFQTELFKDLFKQHEKIINSMKAFYGINDITLPTVWRIADDLFCLRSHNATLPTWYTEDAAKELDSLTDKFFELIYNDPEILKLAVGVFLKDAFDRMERYIQKNINFTDSSPANLESLLAYSAHDTNVAPLLGALGAYNGEAKPPYASLVALELLAPPVDDDESQYMLRLRYKRGWRDDVGDYLPFGACRRSDGEKHDASKGCPFVVVRESIASLLVAPDEIEAICEADWLPARYRLVVAITLSTFLALLTFTFAAVYFVVWRQRRTQHSGGSFAVGSNLPYEPLLSTPPTA